ncbi:hypothetical protein LWI29_035702 [Acer saccharum]|uniref:Gnk2-homologous domain-containing protein n=1 Tax=Acer saccharum TaxID=4024 RepID=A0AA39SGH9_ACESA|nr:hypothetical protein LWI29_035702 [Acer saccharum]
MSSSRFSSSLYLLAFAFLLQTAFGADPLFHFCSSSENFTANGPYEANLNKLAGYLYYQAPPTGFAKGALGEKPNQANGLALCRGDVSSSDCKTCVVEASSEIRKRCPKNKAAIIWYDNCLFKYTDKDFFGQIDNQNKFYMWNVKVVSEPEAFNQNTKELLSQLAKEAQATSKLYAVGEVKLGESKKLYGLTQCTRDLSSYECKKCLDGIIGELPSCCDGKEGDPLDHYCFIKENYTASASPQYRAILNNLLKTLISKTPPTGLGYDSSGHGQNRVNGLALCQGDVSSTNWKISYTCLIYVCEADNPKAFNRKIKELLSRLSGKAASGDSSSKMYATGELELEAPRKLYGLVQCTRGLSDCKKCLDDAISILPICCDGKRSGRVLGGSCNVRYELNSF